MKVLFDHQIFSVQRYGGISRYFDNLNNGLNATPGVSSEIGALYSENEYIRDAGVLMNNSLGSKLFNGHFNRIYRWNRRYSELKIKLNSFDVFHPTYYDPYFIGKLKKPFVVTVHDMIHELMPGQFTDNDKVVAQKKTMITSADAIIAISAATRNDIIRFYPQVASKIRVIYHGYRLGKQAAAAPEAKRDFILFVGERARYKNFSAFVKAISPLLNDDATLSLLCTGGGAFTTEEQHLFTMFNVGAQCRQVSATDQELQQFYMQARLFAFPSLVEGFGFPLLEAFKCGCPVVASNTSCFPEIGGDAIAYFDPTDARSIYDTVKSVLADGLIRERLVDKGFERLTRFTVEKQVADTLALYRELAS